MGGADVARCHEPNLLRQKGLRHVTRLERILQVFILAQHELGDWSQH